MMQSSSPTPSSFSMLFSKPYDHHDSYTHCDRHNNSYDHYYHYDHSDTYSFSNPVVDCTLSLGTPSTRLSPDDENDNTAAANKRSSRQSRNDKRRSSDSSSRVSNFCWDLFQPKYQSTNEQTTSYKHNNRVSNNNSNNNSNGSNNDPLSARRCANCDTTSTPLWRNGPRGPKSLCNACGIRFKKEERRATAAAANPAAPIDQPSGHVYGHHYNNMNQYLNSNTNNNNNWNNLQQYSHYSQPQKNNFNNDQFRFIDNDVDTVDSGISFLSWRLNVTDRPSLVHDFTR